MIEYVTKRDGTVEKFNADKLNGWGQWASENCGVAWSDIVLETVKKLHNHVTTIEIQDALIETCILRKDSGHSKMAARLLMGKIYKEAFDDFSVPHLRDFYHLMVEEGYWADLGYSDDELDQLDKAIDHTKDFTYSYSTLRQFYDKYAVSVFGVCLESPQMALMGLSMSNMRNDPNRIDTVIDFYKELSDLKINLPTPTLNGERTPLEGSPSCCVISGGDSIGSIGAATHVAYQMTAQRSGIGVELETRAPKDPVKGGKIEHGGKFSYYSYVDRAVKANKQLTRGGSATVTFTCYDKEIDTLTMLKSNKTLEQNRLSFIDYSMVVNTFMLQQVALDKPLMLVSPYFAKKLYDILYTGDVKAFVEEYESILNNQAIKKELVSARSVLVNYLQQRIETGRMYLTFIDNVNTHTPFKDPIRLSNLCQEIMLPTNGFDDMRNLFDPNASGEVALCFLASIVASHEFTDEEYEKIAYLVCKAIDNTIESSVYPFPAIEKTAKARRSIGVGLTDVAYYMAKHNLKYDTEEGRNALHRLAERHSYFLHKASVRLAKERGACEWMHKTKYSDESPWLPIDTYSRQVDEYHSQDLQYDWEALRNEIKEYGVRFSVLEAYMPVESSSVFTNSCNGIYPIRRKTIFKKSRKGSVFFHVPDIDTIGNQYQLAWEIDQMDMVVVYSIFQKFTGQSISADFYVDYSKNPNGISMKDMVRRVLFAQKMGMKTFYYEVSNVDNKASEDYDVANKETDDGCDSCKL